jgi:voltage-gated potassium channel
VADDSNLQGEHYPGDQVNTIYEIFILTLAILSLIGLVFIFFIPVSSNLKRILLYFDFSLSFIFLFDFFRSLRIEPIKKQYLKWGWLDLMGGIPGVPVFHFARVARVVRGFIRLRSVRMRDVEEQYRGQRAQSVLLTTFLVAIIVIIISSLLIFRIESRDPSGNIKTGEDALWWALVTISTVGFGDQYPVTESGRLIASIVIIVGVATFGVITSYISSRFLSRRDIKEELNELRADIAEIKQLLQEKKDSTPIEQGKKDPKEAKTE